MFNFPPCCLHPEPPNHLLIVTVFFKMTITAYTSRSKTEVIRKRYININTCTLFTQAFKPTPALSSVPVNDPVDSFSSEVINVIDTMKTKVVSGKKKEPWRNTTLLKAQKKECRQTGCRWRKNKLQIHYNIYKERLCI